MNKPLFVIALASMVSLGLSGCLGGDDTIDLSAPLASFTVTPVDGTLDTFVFDASSSKGNDLTYAWDFGDRDREQPSTGSVVEHQYRHGDATYRVTLVVTDADGVQGIETADVVVGTGENTAPEGLYAIQWRMYGIGEPVKVDASESSDPDGDPVLYDWDFNFFMNGNQYLDFRAAKESATPVSSSAAVEGGDPADSGSDGAGAREDATVDPFELPGGKELRAVMSPGHGASPSEISSTSQATLKRQTDTPQYTLEEGFPEAGIFFVRLTVSDPKGASQPIWSEEIIPVKVVDAKEDRFITGTMDGNFVLGTTGAVNQQTPDSDETGYADSREHTFEIPRDPLRMFVNLTWNSIGDVPANADNTLTFELKTATGQKRGPLSPDVDDEDEDGVTTESGFEFIYDDNVGIGTFTATITATHGADIDYTLTYWAELDFDDFRDLEADYR